MASSAANPNRPELTAEQVRELFDYREDGNLIWRKKPSKGIRAGSVAGAKSGTKERYRRVKINGFDYALHRVIYLWHHGDSPPVVDHRNRDKQDNRIENLRPGNIAQNAWNVAPSRKGKLGHKGITYRPDKPKKYVVEVRANGRRVVHQSCRTLEEALAIAREARRVYHGEFSCDEGSYA